MFGIPGDILQVAGPIVCSHPVLLFGVLSGDLHWQEWRSEKF